MAQLSKTRMKERSRRKTNPVVQGILAEAMKHEAWHPLVQRLSGPTRRHVAINLFQLSEQAKEGETLVVPGSILSLGLFEKKCTIAPLKITATAKAKLAENKTEIVDILELIKKNPSAKGVRIVA